MIAYTYYQSDPRVIREAEAAVSAGFEVDFFALQRGQDSALEIIRGVRVYRLRQSRYRGASHLRYLLAYFEFFVRCFFKSALFHLKRRYRVIHVNNMPDFLVFATLIPKALGAKIILDIHDPMPNTFASKFRTGEGGFYFRVLRWQELLSVRYSHQVVTVSEPVKSGVLVKHGLRPDSILPICNFPDENLFALNPNYHVTGKIRMVFHGTILQRYGLRNLLLAVSRMDHRDKIEVKIIGEGDFSETLKELIKHLGLEGVVCFDNQIHPVTELPYLLSDCQVGLSPLEISSITNYALPLKLLEYTALGLPVITVRSAAIMHYFQEEDCLFYQWDDIESLRRVLDSVAQNPHLLSHYRQRALAVREKFSWTSEKQKYIALLSNLAGGADSNGSREKAMPERIKGAAKAEKALVTPPLVSVIIVSWNAREYLRQCLVSLSTQACPYPTEIIVVDNASSDGSPDIVEREFTHVRLIRNETNLGFSKANNIGIRESSGAYVCLVNSDVRVLPGCLAALVNFMEAHEGVGLAGPRMFSPSGDLGRSCRGFPTPWNLFCVALGLDALFPRVRFFGGYSLRYWAQDTTRPVDILGGWFLIVRRAALQEVGLLDEQFFFYAEDMDWCKRFHEKSLDVTYVSDAASIHYGGGSSRNAPVTYALQQLRANFQYFGKHHSKGEQFLCFCICIMHQFIRLVGHGLVLLFRPRDTDRSYKVRRSWCSLKWLLHGRA